VTGEEQDLGRERHTEGDTEERREGEFRGLVRGGERWLPGLEVPGVELREMERDRGEGRELREETGWEGERGEGRELSKETGWEGERGEGRELREETGWEREREEVEVAKRGVEERGIGGERGVDKLLVFGAAIHRDALRRFL
jgi:hypothetical protein